MIPVSSLDDPRVAAYRWVAQPERLAAEGLVVIEGRLLLPRMLALSARPGRWSAAALSVLLSPAAHDQIGRLADTDPGVPVYVAPQALMDGLVGFNVHRGCLALARRPSVASLDATSVQRARRLVVLEAVNNPDNVGGIFRSAAAFGVDLVVLGPACADPLYRKSVRTSMGATLEVPYVTTVEWPAALDLIRANDCEVVALTTARGAPPLARFMPARPRVALLAGAEGAGLSAAALAGADRRITIPMSGPVDSLNVTVATSIALYHVSVSDRT